MTKYLSWKTHLQVEETQNFINHCILKWDFEGELPFCIYHKTDAQVIGMLEFRIDKFKADFGYVLGKKYWNKGYMTEALNPVVKYILSKDEIYKIWAFHDIDNPASGKVMEKLGLRFVCKMRNWVIHPNISEKPRDCHIYSLDK